MFSGLFTNWKTSVTGSVLLVLGVAEATLGLHIPGFSMEPGAAIVMGLGLLNAKDGNVTGGTVAMTIEALKRTGSTAAALAIAICLSFAATTRLRAADMPTPKPSPVAVVQTAGAGIYVGGLFADAKSRGNFEGIGVDTKAAGAMGGALIGYAGYLQTTLFAFEADTQYTWGRDDRQCGNVACDMRPSWLLTQRVVVGMPLTSLTGATQRAAAAPASQWPVALTVPASLSAATAMPYVTAGVAERRIETCEQVSCAKTWAVGWTLGGGFRIPISAGFSADIGYLYVNFGKHRDTSEPTFSATSEQIMRAAVHYHM